MRSRFLAVVCLVLLAATANARADDSEGLYTPGMSAAIDLGRYRTDFAYADGNHRADIGRYAIVYVQPVAPDVGFGLQGGYMTASVNNATLAPLSDGYGPFLGLFAAWHPLLGNYLAFDFNTGYTWHDMHFRAPAQQADLTWYTSFISLGPVLRLWRWRVSAGGYYQNFNGSETDSGTITGRQDFSAARSTGAYFGFAYFLDRTGSVGLYATGGARHGVQLVFKRQF